MFLFINQSLFQHISVLIFKFLKNHEVPEKKVVFIVTKSKTTSQHAAIMNYLTLIVNFNHIDIFLVVKISKYSVSVTIMQ